MLALKTTSRTEHGSADILKIQIKLHRHEHLCFRGEWGRYKHWGRWNVWLHIQQTNRRILTFPVCVPGRRSALYQHRSALFMYARRDLIISVLNTVFHNKQTLVWQPLFGLSNSCEQFEKIYCRAGERMLAMTKVRWNVFRSRVTESVRAGVEQVSPFIGWNRRSRQQRMDAAGVIINVNNVCLRSLWFIISSAGCVCLVRSPWQFTLKLKKWGKY